MNLDERIDSLAEKVGRTLGMEVAAKGDGKLADLELNAGIKQIAREVVEFVKPERVDVVGKYEPTDEGGIVVSAGSEVPVDDTGADLVHLAEFAQDTGINMAVDHIENKQKELGL